MGFPINVAIGYVHQGTLRAEFVESLFKVTQSTDIVRIAKDCGALISRGRNEVVRAFLNQTDCTHLWFVDTDMVFDATHLHRLAQADRPIVSALYYGIHQNGERFPVAHHIHEGRIVRARPKGNIAEVDAVGMGCCLIKREVLEALNEPEPYAFFQETTWNDQPVGEDVTFCLRAQRAGHKSYVATKVRAGHVKTTTI